MGLLPSCDQTIWAADNTAIKNARKVKTLAKFVMFVLIVSVQSRNHFNEKLMKTKP